MNEEEILAAFAGETIERAGEIYFPQATAQHFIDACDREGFAIIGIEGFRLSTYLTEPDPNWVADFSERRGLSSDLFRCNNNEAARRFIAKIPSGLHLNFVIVQSKG